MDKNIKLEQKLVNSDRKNKKNVHFGNLGNKNKYNKSLIDSIELAKKRVNEHNENNNVFCFNDIKNKDVKTTDALSNYFTKLGTQGIKLEEGFKQGIVKSLEETQSLHQE